MADPTPYPDSHGDTGVGPDRASTTGRPRWVKVFGIIALAVIALFVIALLGGGSHGPARHTSSGAIGDSTPAASIAVSLAGDHPPPGGGHRWS